MRRITHIVYLAPSSLHEKKYTASCVLYSIETLRLNIVLTAFDDNRERTNIPAKPSDLFRRVSSYFSSISTALRRPYYVCRNTMYKFIMIHPVAPILLLISASPRGWPVKPSGTHVRSYCTRVPHIALDHRCQ